MMELRWYCLFFAGLLITALVLASPVLADSSLPDGTTIPGPDTTAGQFPGVPAGSFPDSIAPGADIPVKGMGDAIAFGPSGSLQAAIDSAADGDTIYLAPGIYREYDLNILDKNLFIVANTTLGGDATNTIIDAGRRGRVFTISGDNKRVVLDDLSLRNGNVTGNGGAIHFSGNSHLYILNSTITGCSADGNGGGVYALGNLDIHDSLITGCSASGNGGAVYSSWVTLLNSTISGSTAGGNGGGIYSYSVIYSRMNTISDCSAGGGGGAFHAVFGMMIYDSTITRCSAAGNGGALNWDGFAEGEIYRTTISRCSSGMDGGGIYGKGDGLDIFDSTITDCTAGRNGGGIDSITTNPIPFLSNYYLNVTITGCRADRGSGGGLYSSNTGDTVILTSSFTGNSASADGGCIWSMQSSGRTEIVSTDFTGCSAGNGNGSAIWFSGPDANMTFSRIYNNPGRAVFSSAGPVVAENNWWGANTGPAAGSVYGDVDSVPWLVLGITASPRTILSGSAAAVQTSLTWNSAGTNTLVPRVLPYHVRDGIPTTFTVTGSGTFNPPTALTEEGIAGTYYVDGGIGVNSVCGTVDGQTVCTQVEVSYPPATMGPFNDDDSLPGITPVPTADPSTVLPMTVTVNIGGNSAAGKTTVTGTKLSGLVVTGTVQPGPGSNQTAPPGIVYQYISLVPAGYTTISSTVINFTVPQSWLEENGIAPAGVVLYHQTADSWEELPTSVLHTKDGRAHFSALSPGFSLFAIAGTPAAAAPATTVVTPAVVSTPAREPGPVRAMVTQAPVVTETTAAPPAVEAPAGSSGFPVVPALIGICCVGLLGGGIAARRWWIRRQNPALFAEYD
jgi:PGF-pre-PGF domain-containing protein